MDECPEFRVLVLIGRGSASGRAPSRLRAAQPAARRSVPSLGDLARGAAADSAYEMRGYALLAESSAQQGALPDGVQIPTLSHTPQEQWDADAGVTEA